MDFDKCVDGTKELYFDGMIPRKRLKYYLRDTIHGIDFVTCPYCQLRVSHLQQKHLATHDKTKDDVLKEFGADYQIVCANASKKKAAASYDVQQRLLAENKHVGWQARNIKSYAEKFWRKVLENNKIVFENEHVVRKQALGLKDASNYFLDFFIGGFIDLEIDGKQHEYEERAESDKERDKLLKMHGFEVYRIPWINPNTEDNKQKVQKQIDDFLNWYHTIKDQDGIIVY